MGLPRTQISPILRRGLRLSLWGISALVLLVIGLRLLIMTPIGAQFIETRVNAMTFGTVETVQIAGLSGDPLGAFQLEQLEIEDKDGVWLRAENVQMAWSPWALLRKKINLELVEIDQMDVLRRPKLNESQPGQETSGYAVRLEGFEITTLQIAEPIIGQSARLTIKGGVARAPDSGLSAHLIAKRTDAPGDSLTLQFDRSSSGNLSGDFTVRGVENGVLARFLSMPENTDIKADGQLSGTEATGQANLVVALGDQDMGTSRLAWTETAAILTADVRPYLWPTLEPVRRLTGDTVEITARLDRGETPYPYRLSLSAPKIAVTATGALTDLRRLPNMTEIEVRIDQAGDFMDLPQGYKFGDLNAKGLVTFDPAPAFDGRVDIKSVTTPYGRMAKMSGPLSLAITDKSRLSFTGQQSLTGIQSTQDLPINLGPVAKLSFDGRYNLERARLRLKRFNLTSPTLSLSAKGEALRDISMMNMSGKLTAKTREIGRLSGGEWLTDYRLVKTKNSDFALSLEGAFRPDGSPSSEIMQLIETGVNFKLDMEPLQGGVRIDQALVTAETFNVALQGHVTETLALSGELMTKSPVSYAALSLPDDLAASFEVSGPRSDPSLRLDATAGQLSMRDYTVDDVRLRTEIFNLVTAPNGPIKIEADTPYGPAEISAQVTSGATTYTANDIAMSVGAMALRGDMSVATSGLADGDLYLDLPDKAGRFASANLSLQAVNDTQRVSLTAKAENLALGAISIDQFAADAEGDINQLVGQVSVVGLDEGSVVTRRFDGVMPFELKKAEAGFDATLSPVISYGALKLETAAPISAHYGAGDIKLNAPLLLNLAPVNIAYRRAEGEENFDMTVQDLPLKTLPLPTSLADTRGRIGAHIVLGSQGGQVTGQSSLTLVDWRGSDVAKSMGLDQELNINVDGTRAAWDWVASSTRDFSARGRGDVALHPARSLSDLRLNMSAPIQGYLEANGAAANILELVSPQDAEPQGQVEARLDISGTAAAPQVEGFIQGQALRMEAPELGTRISDGRFKADFTNDRLTLSELYLSDSDVGVLRGTGEFKLGEFGRPIGALSLQADSFLAMDRRDYTARVDGDIIYESDADKSILRGDVVIDRADVKQFVSGTAAVVVIDVEEINRPDNIKPVTIRPPAKPIVLDLKVRAPRRIFIRSQGLDVEIALDAQLKGEATAPLIYGQATVLRGGYRLAGKTLQFETGDIRFDGKLSEGRVNMTATTQTQNMSAKIQIGGSVSKPEIKLSSSPERPQDEILSALLFGRSATDLTTLEAAQLARALAQFSGTGGGFDLLGGLRDALGIGRLSVGVAEDGSTQIRGGRYLAKNVYLEVFSGGGTKQTGAIIEWEIRENLALRSKLQADTEQSFSLKWKRDF